MNRGAKAVFSYPKIIKQPAMSTFVIEGKQKLQGSIVPQGAKNEALQVISAILLTSEEVIIHKIPNIRDVNKLIQLLMDLGAKVKKLDEESYSFQADSINSEYMETEFYPSPVATKSEDAAWILTLWVLKSWAPALNSTHEKISTALKLMS